MSDSAFSKTFNNVIRRPELASLVGAIVIFILFVAVAPPFRSIDAFSTVLYASSTMGIVALAVGLLMIGDEFDLSSGVAVTSTALIATMLNYNLHLNSWVGVFISLASALSIGALNGVLVTRTGIPSFLITLSVFLMLQGLNLAVTKFVTGRVATPIISDMQGFPSAQKVFSSTLHIGPWTFGLPFSGGCSLLVRHHICFFGRVLATGSLPLVVTKTLLMQWVFRSVG